MLKMAKLLRLLSILQTEHDPYEVSCHATPMGFFYLGFNTDPAKDSGQQYWGVNHFSISRLNLNFKILGEIWVSDTWGVTYLSMLG